MQIPEIIKSSLDYIEQNLKTDISAEELAKKGKQIMTNEGYGSKICNIDATITSCVLV
jgi:hypothetical protein